jgi:hypothetical protein
MREPISLDQAEYKSALAHHFTKPFWKKPLLNVQKRC